MIPLALVASPSSAQLSPDDYKVAMTVVDQSGWQTVAMARCGANPSALRAAVSLMETQCKFTPAEIAQTEAEYSKDISDAQAKLKGQPPDCEFASGDQHFLDETAQEETDAIRHDCPG
jgi:hypothetical protein